MTVLVYCALHLPRLPHKNDKLLNNATWPSWYNIEKQSVLCLPRSLLPHSSILSDELVQRALSHSKWPPYCQWSRPSRTRWMVWRLAWRLCVTMKPGIGVERTSVFSFDVDKGVWTQKRCWRFLGVFCIFHFYFLIFSMPAKWLHLLTVSSSIQYGNPFYWKEFISLQVVINNL